jgi:hypothetical protein
MYLQPQSILYLNRETTYCPDPENGSQRTILKHFIFKIPFLDGNNMLYSLFMKKIFRKDIRQRKYRSKKRHYHPSPTSMNELMNKQINRFGIQGLYKLEIIRQLWPQAAGPYVARYATPIRLIRKSLRIATSDATWMTEMTYLAESILKRLQDLLPGNWVKELKIVTVESSQVLWPLAEKSAYLKTIHPTKEMLDRVDLATCCIQDEQLCKSIKKAMLASIGKLENQDNTHPNRPSQPPTHG